MTEPGRFLFRLAWITLAAILVAFVWQSVPLIQSRLLSGSSEPRLVTPRGDLAADEQTTIAIFRTARDSVVYISTAERVLDPWTRNVHDQPRGTGSGFVWDDLGHVVTNAHVVEGASSATVRLADGRSFPAELVGVSPDHDLAVLRISVGSARPEPLPIGSSAGLEVGQTVFAIGNPFGLDWTLTRGIVSALDRELPDRGAVITGLIQTDAAINPGNSGGPLLDSAGRLVGVNTAIFSPSGASAGIGFAVPVDAVNRVVPQLIARGNYTPPSLGVRTDSRVDAMAQRRGIEGVVILDVTPGSPADRAGLRPAEIGRDGTIRPHDLILAVDGRRVASTEELLAALETHKFGRHGARHHLARRPPARARHPPRPRPLTAPPPTASPPPDTPGNSNPRTAPRPRQPEPTPSGTAADCPSRAASPRPGRARSAAARRPVQTPRAPPQPPRNDSGEAEQPPSPSRDTAPSAANLTPLPHAAASRPVPRPNLKSARRPAPAPAAAHIDCALAKQLPRRPSHSPGSGGPTGPRKSPRRTKARAPPRPGRTVGHPGAGAPPAGRPAPRRRASPARQASARSRAASQGNPPRCWHAAAPPPIAAPRVTARPHRGRAPRRRALAPQCRAPAARGAAPAGLQAAASRASR